MTPEQQREQWLKRILPALVVLVIYFAIISGFVTEKSKKAQAQYVGLQQKGIDAAALPGIEQQQRGISDEIAKLEQEDKAMHDAFAANSGFLSRSVSSNDAIERISVILANNNLQVLDEKRNDKPSKDTLPRSLCDTQHWLKDILSVAPVATAVVASGANTDDKDLNIWTIRYIGRYLDNYRALSALLDSDVKALPVSLTMQAYKANPGKQEWLLTLWL
ncbi:MAG: hypothetical protein NTX38_19250 [Methylobacter sp.]|nr:hypothetical protein [Methylobacter sp.]